LLHLVREKTRSKSKTQRSVGTKSKRSTAKECQEQENDKKEVSRDLESLPSPSMFLFLCLAAEIITQRP
jgi:hypothetical protein